MEHAREDRLFEDPRALLLAGEEGAAWIAQRTGAGPFRLFQSGCPPFPTTGSSWQKS